MGILVFFNLGSIFKECDSFGLVDRLRQLRHSYNGCKVDLWGNSDSAGFCRWQAEIVVPCPPCPTPFVKEWNPFFFFQLEKVGLQEKSHSEISRELSCRRKTAVETWVKSWGEEFWGQQEFISQVMAEYLAVFNNLDEGTNATTHLRDVVGETFLVKHKGSWTKRTVSRRILSVMLSNDLKRSRWT